MSKASIIGAACTATAAAAGAAYYVSPASQSSLDTPPILVDGTPEQTLAKVRQIRLKNYLQQIGGSSRDAEIVHMALQTNAPDDVVATISLASERVLVLHATARSAGSGQTSLDITAELPESRLSTNPALHPYDLKAMAAIADFAATDYVSSIFKGQRMASHEEIGRALVERIGFDEDERRTFSERVRDALRAAYQPKNPWSSDYDPSGPYDPTPPGWLYQGTDPSGEAERAADSARNAAESAAWEARRAAEQARDATSYRSGD